MSFLKIPALSDISDSGCKFFYFPIQGWIGLTLPKSNDSGLEDLWHRRARRHNHGDLDSSPSSLLAKRLPATAGPIYPVCGYHTRVHSVRFDRRREGEGDLVRALDCFKLSLDARTELEQVMKCIKSLSVCLEMTICNLLVCLEKGNAGGCPARPLPCWQLGSATPCAGRGLSRGSQAC